MLLNRIVEIGLPKDERKFRNLGDNIYELKTRRGIRILCFFAGSILPKSLILTQGFYKPKSQQLRREKIKAINLLKEFSEDVDIV